MLKKHHLTGIALCATTGYAQTDTSGYPRAGTTTVPFNLGIIASSPEPLVGPQGKAAKP